MAKIKQLQWLNSKLQMRILWGVVLVSSWFLMRCSQNMPNWFSVGTGLQNSEPDILNGLSWALIYDIFSFILPNGYIIIFSTSTPRILADIK